MYLRGDKMSIASVANKKMPRRSNCRQQALLERKTSVIRKKTTKSAKASFSFTKLSIESK